MTPLRFGPAGIPYSSPKPGLLEGIKHCATLGLNAMELEFVRGVYLKEETAREARPLAEKLGIALTVHAPYYINLNSEKEETVKASMQRLLLSCKMGGLAGATSVAVHAAYRHATPAQELTRIVHERCVEVQERVDQEHLPAPIKVAPELAGKHSQWGTLEEVLELAQDKRLGFCIDFAHHHAKTNGSLTTQKAFDKLLEAIEKTDSNHLKNMHIQCAGIQYSEKGERNHLPFQHPQNTLNWKALAQSLQAFDVRGTVIVESPAQEDDALLLKNHYDSI
ncbi:MAG: TIM barrel protein [Candidatus Diapherotrites archaeon]|nr:TIM barrel protein [Candidatus Diapherotrites archaeon]